MTPARHHLAALARAVPARAALARAIPRALVVAVAWLGLAGSGYA